MEQLYFRDYAAHWSEAIAQLNILPAGSAAQGAAQLAGLTAANSPLLQLLLEVRENTRFAGLVEATAGAGELAEAAQAPAASSARQPSWQPPPPSKPRPHC